MICRVFFSNYVCLYLVVNCINIVLSVWLLSTANVLCPSASVQSCGLVPTLWFAPLADVCSSWWGHFQVVPTCTSWHGLLAIGSAVAHMHGSLLAAGIVWPGWPCDTRSSGVFWQQGWGAHISALIERWLWAVSLSGVKRCDVVTKVRLMWWFRVIVDRVSSLVPYLALLHFHHQPVLSTKPTPSFYLPPGHPSILSLS